MVPITAVMVEMGTAVVTLAEELPTTVVAVAVIPAEAAAQISRRPPVIRQPILQAVCLQDARQEIQVATPAAVPPCAVCNHVVPNRGMTHSNRYSYPTFVSPVDGSTK